MARHIHTEDLQQLRTDTRGCNTVNHLNNAGAALMPRQVTIAIDSYLDREEQYGGYETAGFYQKQLDGFYDAAATLLNCGSRNIAFTTSATDSYNKALSSVPFRHGDVILISENDYPSNFIAFLSLQKRFGIQIIRISNTASGELDLADLEQKIKSYAPRLISISHVPTSSGLVQPVAEIGELIKKYDIFYLLDACQSVGQMKVDTAATGADFVSGTMRKFLRGPRGAGFLYVSDKALEAGLEPLFLDLRGAAWTSADEYAPLPDAKRFEDWEKSGALKTGSTEALKYALAVGIDAIEERNKMLAGRLRKALLGMPAVTLQDRGKNPCAIVTFSLQTNLSDIEVRRFFNARNINIYTTQKSSALIDFGQKNIEWVLRVSPHYYNTIEELDAFITALEALIRNEAGSNALR